MRPIFIIAVVLLTQLTYGQTVKETRTASLVDGDYSLEGTVYLELFDDNSLNLRFGSDYLTGINGNVYDVHVYLSTTNNYQRPIDTSNMLLVSNIGTISGLDYLINVFFDCFYPNRFWLSQYLLVNGINIWRKSSRKK